MGVDPLPRYQRFKKLVELVNSELSYTAVLCSYNAEQTICEAIKSILDQSIIFEELIIVDDCSTDSTISQISKFSINNSKIVIDK